MNATSLISPRTNIFIRSQWLCFISFAVKFPNGSLTVMVFYLLSAPVPFLPGPSLVAFPFLGYLSVLLVKDMVRTEQNKQNSTCEVSSRKIPFLVGSSLSLKWQMLTSLFSCDPIATECNWTYLWFLAIEKYSQAFWVWWEGHLHWWEINKHGLVLLLKDCWCIRR